jgi:nucleotide-binding universal stress UspA family protein
MLLRFPPRRILVAVESSKESLYAWNAAKEIAKRYGAGLEAIWCVAPVATEMTGLPGLSRAPSYRAESLRRLRARLGPGARLHAVDGDPAVTIRRVARERRCDLIVLGTRPRPELARWVQGSVAEAVIRGASCPVLVVPRAWRAPRKILAPVHGAGYARRGLMAAAVLARAYGGRLTMLEVVDKPSLAVISAKRMSVQAGKLPASVFRAAPPEYEVRVGDPVREILRAERARDMVVLVAHRKSFLGDMFKGTTVERVLRRSRLPVLAIPSR